MTVTKHISELGKATQLGANQPSKDVERRPGVVQSARGRRTSIMDAAGCMKASLIQRRPPKACSAPLKLILSMDITIRTSWQHSAKGEKWDGK